jgi:hypothetical protein
MKRATLIILSTLAALLATGHAVEGENLLKNPGIEQDAKGIPGWKISEASMGDVAAFSEKARWGAVEGPDGNSLTIAIKEPNVANVWWQQDLKGIGGTTYEVRVEVKGTLQYGSKYGVVKIGIHFLDKDGQWLGFEPISDHELSDTWTTVTGKITAPADAVGMGFRLGIMCDGVMEVFFKNPSLAEVL